MSFSPYMRIKDLVGGSEHLNLIFSDTGGGEWFDLPFVDLAIFMNA